MCIGSGLPAASYTQKFPVYSAREPDIFFRNCACARAITENTSGSRDYFSCTFLHGSQYYGKLGDVALESKAWRSARLVIGPGLPAGSYTQSLTFPVGVYNYRHSLVYCINHFTFR